MAAAIATVVSLSAIREDRSAGIQLERSAHVNADQAAAAPARCGIQRGAVSPALTAATSKRGWPGQIAIADASRVRIRLAKPALCKSRRERERMSTQVSGWPQVRKSGHAASKAAAVFESRAHARRLRVHLPRHHLSWCRSQSQRLRQRRRLLYCPSRSRLRSLSPAAPAPRRGWTRSRPSHLRCRSERRSS